MRENDKSRTIKAPPVPPVPAACVAISFICFLGWLKFEDLMPIIGLKAYFSLSAISFAAYASDKSSAVRGRSRIPEKLLLTIDALGGWLGGLAAQTLFRHKTRKFSYQARFWLLSIAHIAIVIAFFYF